MINKKRLVSLDALRGFNMFWIIGVRDIANGLAHINVPEISLVTTQLYHSKWNGFTFYDLIFPMFIFLIGVSMVLSVQKRLEKGESRGSIVRHVLKRTVILFFLGLIYNDLIANWPHLANIRIMGVLQRSALCYLAASLLVIYTKPRTQALTVVGILAAYWAAMRFIPVPGYGPGYWSAQGSLVRYVDNLLLPGKLDYGNWDSEGLLSTIPAIASCLLGALSGCWLWTAKFFPSLKENRRTLYLFLAGVVLVALGFAVNPFFPINKKLWTSSYVLLTGGLSAMFLAAFYWIIDLKGYRRWAFPFVIIGMNSIFIYMGARFIPFGNVVQWILGGNLLALFGQSQDLLSALARFSLEGLVLLLLYNRRIFIRV